VLAQPTPETIPYEARLDEGEAPSDLALALWTKGLFFHHG
jgi:hypothetical protein